MKLSVLITTYNSAKYIDETLKSVFAQRTEYSFEVIIGDDGSADGTMDKILEWKNQYPNAIQYYIMPRDPRKTYNPIHRASANRLNIAVHARGEYITFLDGDDFYTDESKFQRQIEILDRKENRECFICMHNMTYYYGNRDQDRIIRDGLKEGKITAKKFWERYYRPAETCIFRNFFNGKVPSFVDPRYFDDNMIIFYGLRFGHIYYIPQAMVSYRQNPTPWKNKDILERELINIMDYDYERRLAPRMRSASRIRHYHDLRHLMKERHQIVKENMSELWTEAKEQQAGWCLNLLEYGEYNGAKKAWIMARFLMETICYVKWRIFIRNEKANG